MRSMFPNTGFTVEHITGGTLLMFMFDDFLPEQESEQEVSLPRE
jgi:hypothetical protein